MTAGYVGKRRRPPLLHRIFGRPDYVQASIAPIAPLADIGAGQLTHEDDARNAAWDRLQADIDAMGVELIAELADISTRLVAEYADGNALAAAYTRANVATIDRECNEITAEILFHPEPRSATREPGKRARRQYHRARRAIGVSA